MDYRHRYHLKSSCIVMKEVLFSILLTVRRTSAAFLLAPWMLPSLLLFYKIWRTAYFITDSILKFQLSITCQVWWVNNGRLSITCQKWWVNKEKRKRTAAKQQHWRSTKPWKQAAVISFFSHHFWQVIDRQWKLTSDVTICDLWLLFEVSKIIDGCQINVLTISVILPYRSYINGK